MYVCMYVCMHIVGNEYFAYAFLYVCVVLKGLYLTKRVSTITKLSLTMHTTMQVPLNKANLTDLATLLETLKAMVRIRALD